jgi:hypothetical protein
MMSELADDLVTISGIAAVAWIATTGGDSTLGMVACSGLAGYRLRGRGREVGS